MNTIIESRIENAIARDFHPLFVRKWKFDNQHVKTFRRSGPYYGIYALNLVCYSIDHPSQDEVNLCHRVGAPAFLQIKNNKVEKMSYWLFGNQLSGSSYWTQVFLMRPDVYQTKLIGTKLFVETTSKKIPSPSCIDLFCQKGGHGLEFQLNGKKIAELKFWNYWEHFFTVLPELGIKN